MRKGTILLVLVSLFSAHSAFANDCTDNALSQRMSCDRSARSASDKNSCKNEHIVAVQLCSQKQFDNNMREFNSAVDNLKSTIEKRSNNGDDN